MIINTVNQSLNQAKIRDNDSIENDYQVQRFLRSFDKNGEDLVAEKLLNNVNLEELQKLFKVDGNNPMYDCYLIESQEQFDYLQNKFNVKLNDDLYDYYLETDTFSEDN